MKNWKKEERKRKEVHKNGREKRERKERKKRKIQ